MRGTAEEFTRYKELSKKILKLDPHIRFVGIINHLGQLIIGSVQKNTKLQVNQNECEMLYMEATMRMKMRQEFDHCLGPVNFAMSHRRNFTITKYPFGDDLVYVSEDENFEFARIPFEIIGILQKERVWKQMSEIKS